MRAARIIGRHNPALVNQRQHDHAKHQAVDGLPIWTTTSFWTPTQKLSMDTDPKKR